MTLPTVRIVAFLLCIAHPLRAEWVEFLCDEERAAEDIALAYSVSDAAADDVAKPIIEKGVCKWLPAEIGVAIIYRGKVFRGGPHGPVQVVGFEENRKRRYGLMPVTETGA